MGLIAIGAAIVLACLCVFTSVHAPDDPTNSEVTGHTDAQASTIQAEALKSSSSQSGRNDVADPIDHNPPPPPVNTTKLFVVDDSGNLSEAQQAAADFMACVNTPSSNDAILALQAKGYFTADYWSGRCKMFNSPRDEFDTPQRIVQNATKVSIMCNQGYTYRVTSAKEVPNLSDARVRDFQIISVVLSPVPNGGANDGSFLEIGTFLCPDGRRRVFGTEYQSPVNGPPDHF